jgi:hypothetical protein
MTSLLFVALLGLALVIAVLLGWALTLWRNCIDWPNDTVTVSGKSGKCPVDRKPAALTNGGILNCGPGPSPHEPFD